MSRLERIGEHVYRFSIVFEIDPEIDSIEVRERLENFTLKLLNQAFSILEEEGKRIKSRSQKS